MEPITHRLTHEGILVPCTSHFPAKYKNVNGGWLSAQREVQGTSAPKLPIDQEERKMAFADDQRPDVQKGGIYNRKDLLAVEKFQEFYRITLGIQAGLANQMNPHHYGSTLTPEDLFPTYENPKTWMRGIWGRFLTFLHTWGEGAAITFSFYLFAKWILQIIEWGYNICVLRDLHGCGRTLCWVPCMSLFLLRAYRDSPFGQRTREDRAKRRVEKARQRTGMVDDHEYVSLG